MTARHLKQLFFHPRSQITCAWVLLWALLVGWPLSMLTWAKNEPPFVLSLSWLALVLTAHNTLLTAYNKTE